MFTPVLAPHGFSLYAQSGNSISGHVFGLDRQPLTDVYVELLDDLNRTIARTRTNGSGRYSFYGLSQGRFRVRAMPLGTNYEEQEEEVEIQNFTSQSALGGVRTSGFSNEQRDFYLRLRKGATAVTNEAVFVQEVPDEAKKLYEKAISDLNEKKEKEGFEGLKSALEIFPKYFAALERLGLEYVRLGHFEAAQILLTIAVDVNPRSFKSGLAFSL
jgi:tetratricopeptide (TPR) repeat protein